VAILETMIPPLFIAAAFASVAFVLIRDRVRVIVRPWTVEEVLRQIEKKEGRHPVTTMLINRTRQRALDDFSGRLHRAGGVVSEMEPPKRPWFAPPDAPDDDDNVYRKRL
jgi:hypothetical protein